MRRPRLAGLAVLALSLGVACGKKGAPLPPYRPDPQPVADVKVSQRGDVLAVSYTAPRLTIEGQRLDVHEVEILVADRSGDINKVGKVHRVVAAPGEARTETVPFPAGVPSVRVAVRARSGGGRSPSSTPVTVTLLPVPAAPASVSAQNDPAGVIVTWATPAPSAAATPAPDQPAPAATPSGTAGYMIERRAPGGSLALLTAKPIAAPPFLDEAALADGRWCYRVRRVASWEPLVTSADSAEACLDVKDVRPPQPPSGLTVQAAGGGLDLTWNAPADTDVALYRVYRSAGGAAPQRLGEVPASTRSFSDTAAVPRTPYRYSVTAVDAAGNESAHGPPAEGTRP